MLIYRLTTLVLQIISGIDVFCLVKTIQKIFIISTIPNPNIMINIFTNSLKNDFKKLIFVSFLFIIFIFNKYFPGVAYILELSNKIQ